MSESATGLSQREDETWYGPVHRIEGSCDCCSEQAGIVPVVVAGVVDVGNDSLRSMVGIMIFFVVDAVCCCCYVSRLKEKLRVGLWEKETQRVPFYNCPSSICFCLSHDVKETPHIIPLSCN